MDRSIWILFPEKARKYAKNKNALFFVKNRTRYLLFLLTRPRKLERHIAARFSFGEKRDKRTRFYFFMSLCDCVYAAQTGTVSRKIKFVIFACSPASIAAALSRTFFACTKKVPKKYPEGLRALSTPGDAVKFLRFDGDTANFAVWRKRIKTHFIFTP